MLLIEFHLGLKFKIFFAFLTLRDNFWVSLKKLLDFINLHLINKLNLWKINIFLIRKIMWIFDFLVYNIVLKFKLGKI